MTKKVRQRASENNGLLEFSTANQHSVLLPIPYFRPICLFTTCRLHQTDSFKTAISVIRVKRISEVLTMGGF